MNILPYGIWNDGFLSVYSEELKFEHSSLWDLKQAVLYSAIRIYPFEHSSLWDLKQGYGSTHCLCQRIWTFFPMGFETYTFQPVLFLWDLNILPYGIWNIESLPYTTVYSNLNILPYGIWNKLYRCLYPSYSYLNILPYGIWNRTKSMKLFSLGTIWTFFPMGFETHPY